MQGSTEHEWRGDFTFVQAADTQLGFISDPTWCKATGGCGSDDGSDWSQEIELCHRMIRCVNNMQPPPRFLCICGDLVHALPDAKWGQDNPSAARYTNHQFYKRQNADFKEAMKELTVPLVCVCGNHDVGDRPTPTSLSMYRSQYGDDYFSFWCGGVYALVINAQLLNDGRDAVEEQAKQAQWLNAELEALAEARRCTDEGHACDSTTNPTNKHKRPKHVIMFQHIPWFLKNQDEPLEGYYNLSPAARSEWLPKLCAAGVSKDDDVCVSDIRLVFCGHYHRNNTSYTDNGSLEVVVTSAVGRQMSRAEVATNKPFAEPSDTKSGVRVVSVCSDGVTHSYEDFDTLEAQLGLTKHGKPRKQFD